MQLYTNIEQLLRNEMQNFPQVISELLLLENVMYGLLLLQSTAGSVPERKWKGKNRRDRPQRKDRTWQMLIMDYRAGHKFQIVEISVYFTNIWERRQFLFWRCLHHLQVKILYRKTNTRLSWERGYLEKYRRRKKIDYGQIWWREHRGHKCESFFVIMKGLASHCKARTTFTFHFYIINA